MEIGLSAVGESAPVGFPGVLMKSVESKRVVRVQNVAFERKRGIVLDGWLDGWVRKVVELSMYFRSTLSSGMETTLFCIDTTTGLYWKIHKVLVRTRRR